MTRAAFFQLLKFQNLSQRRGCIWKLWISSQPVTFSIHNFEKEGKKITSFAIFYLFNLDRQKKESDNYVSSYFLGASLSPFIPRGNKFWNFHNNWIKVSK